MERRDGHAYGSHQIPQEEIKTIECSPKVAVALFAFREIRVPIDSDASSVSGIPYNICNTLLILGIFLHAEWGAFV